MNNPEDNKKKIIQDVRKKGDVYFRSGDIVVMDKYGWLYFKVNHDIKQGQLSWYQVKSALKILR